MNDKHICDILESLHQRLFKLEAYNPELAATKLIQLITVYQNWRQGRGRRYRWFMNNGISHHNPSRIDSMRDIGGNSGPYGDFVRVGGRDYIIVDGENEYENCRAQVTFTGVYKVWVRPNQRSVFLAGPEFILPTEVVDYFDQQVFPEQYREWVQPSRIVNPRDVDFM